MTGGSQQRMAYLGAYAIAGGLIALGLLEIVRSTQRSEPAWTVLGFVCVGCGGYILAALIRRQLLGPAAGPNGSVAGKAAQHENQRRVYRAIMRGEAVDPQDRETATAVLRRTMKPRRLVILYVALACAIWQFLDEVVRFAASASVRTAVTTVVWAIPLALLLIFARRQLRLRRWQRRYSEAPR